mgnify:CR=1 FL=1
MKKVFMFSGQGAQYVGMGKEFFDHSENAKNIFLKADDILGYKLSDIIFENEEKLNDTLYTQVAMFTLYAATLEVLKENNIEADFTCGLSLGEYGAMYYSNVFDFETGLNLLQKRGEFMNQACLATSGKMSAIIGLDSDILLDIIENVSGYVKIANYNTYGQLVISGEENAVLKVNELALEQGAKRAILLNTSGPFHTELMKDASIKLGNYVAVLELDEPTKKLLLNTTGDFYDQENLKVEMPKQITSSVLFYQMIEKLLEQGVDTFIEIGPKKTLSGFVKKINRKLNIVNVEDMVSLNKTIAKLEE